MEPAFGAGLLTPPINRPINDGSGIGHATPRCLEIVGWKRGRYGDGRETVCRRAG